MVSAHTDDGSHVNIPVVTFTRTNDGEVEATNARLADALAAEPSPRPSRAVLPRH